jgi:hypothetical protein
MGIFVAIDSQAMDAQVAAAIAYIGRDIEALHVPKLRGVVLGGGYARGEGGVLVDDAGEHLYNDLDFYVVTEDGATADERTAIAEALVPLAQRWSKRLEVDVDFCPPKTPWRIKHDEARVMIQELVHGYKDVAGMSGEEMFKDVVRRPPEAFPWTEAVRLLVNRGAGLTLARESEDATFAERNVNKCVLGAGDAVLIARHAYAWKMTDRAAALKWPEYDAAMAWKFRPRKGGVCDWETARGLWLRAVDEVRAAGRAGGEDRRTLYQAVRWIVRRRTVGDLRTLGQGAVVRILRNLERAVRERRGISAALRKDWNVFN